MLISRYIDTGKQYIGNGFLLSDYDNLIEYEFRTLELSWKNNKNNISCIPKGSYKVVKRHSEKFKNHFHILDVENRDFILIHNANFYTELRGCIAIGSDLQYLNTDNEIDVVNSKNTLKELYSILPESFDLEIVER